MSMPLSLGLRLNNAFLFKGALPIVPSNATLAAIISNSTAPNSPAPQGLPATYDWYSSGRVNLGNNPGVFTHALPWGLFYLAAGATINPDVLLGVQYLSLYILDGVTWRKFHGAMRPVGALYNEDFSLDANTPAPPWSLPPNAFITQLSPGKCFHFWSSDPRTDISGMNIQGLIISFEARLFSKSGADISGAVGNYIANAGVDYWSTLNGGYQAPHGTSNDDAVIGSFKVAGTSWRKVYVTNLTIEQLQANRPPNDLEQLTQTDPQTLDPTIVVPDENGGFTIDATSTASYELVGTGYEGNIAYVDYRIFATAAANQNVLFIIPEYAQLAIAGGETVQTSVRITKRAEAAGGLVYAALGVFEFDAAAGFLAFNEAEIALPGTGDLASNLRTYSRATGAATKKANGRLTVVTDASGTAEGIVRIHFGRTQVVA